MDGESAFELRRPVGANFGPAIGMLLFSLVAVAGFTWAKWWPYSHKLVSLLSTRKWSGTSIFDSAGSAGVAPSIHGAWAFTVSYFDAIWIALIAGLLVASAVEAFLPRSWLLGALSRKGKYTGPIAGGLLAIPCMMCTCCGAPVAATLRRNGVPASASLAYWIGNPTLNPAVLAFLALVAPWQWVVTRVVVGAFLVFVVTTIVSNITKAESSKAEASASHGEQHFREFRLAEAPMRFFRALTRLCLTLLPEYLLVVLFLGLFRGWLFPFGSNTVHWGILAVFLAVVVGTMMVIPTAGEIPILLGLASAGAGAGVIGALLITLPAISLPSMAMVGRVMSVKVTVVMAAAVAATGVVSAALLWALLR